MKKLNLKISRQPDVTSSSGLSRFLLLVSVISIAISCSTAASKNARSENTDVPRPGSNSIANSANGGATISIEPNSPADTVRVFYKHLREKKFREAIFLTNLRPAIEGLTDDEMKGFSLDFEAIAGAIPTEIQINGEIITGDTATVTANLPDLDTDEVDLQQIKLKKINDAWIIQTVDDEAEKRIRDEGKAYFYNLRIETHEDEARKMLERISKAELAHSLQNGGVFTDAATLIKAGFLPDDVLTSESTGYNYVLKLTDDKRNYYATATPAEYGKSGRLSFLLEPGDKGISRVSSKDLNGQPIKK